MVGRPAPAIWPSDTAPAVDAGVKKDRYKGMVEVHPHVHLGRPEAYEHALRAAGFTGRIQTAFIERLSLTIRRSIAGLTRRS